MLAQQAQYMWFCNLIGFGTKLEFGPQTSDAITLGLEHQHQQHKIHNRDVLVKIFERR